MTIEIQFVKQGVSSFVRKNTFLKRKSTPVYQHVSVKQLKELVDFNSAWQMKENITRFSHITINNDLYHVKPKN